MFAALAMPLLLVIFVTSTGAIRVSGTTLSRSTDHLCGRLGWGEALGGVVHSLAVLVLFAAGMAGLVAIATHGSKG